MNKTLPTVDHRTCQVFCIDRMAEPGGNIGVEKQPLRHRLRLALRRIFKPSARRKIKGHIDDLVVFLSRLTRKNEAVSMEAKDMTLMKFNSDDTVRVKAKEQIQATLNHWNELKGCSFLPEMWQYCGTTQRVFKLVRRIVDERDCRVKKVSEIYLLQGVYCQGFELYGECDRACFYFWRGEWLEKIGE